MQRKQRRVVSWTEQELQALCIGLLRRPGLWSSKVTIELMLPVNVCPRGERDHDQEDDNATETA